MKGLAGKADVSTFIVILKPSGFPAGPLFVTLVFNTTIQLSG
jgi:hypothetical protein